MCCLLSFVVWEPHHGDCYPFVQMCAEPSEGLGSFPVIHTYECFTFTWSKWQFSLFPSSWQNLQWSCPCPQDKIKTQGLTQISGLLGPHLCHQHYHPPLVPQPWAPAPRLCIPSQMLCSCFSAWLCGLLSPTVPPLFFTWWVPVF